MTSRDARERGSAVVEFLGSTLILLIPLVYLVLTLVELQAAAFAAQSAAREAGRFIATADPSNSAAATALAAQSTQLIFADQGIDIDGTEVLQVACPSGCLPGERALIRVSVDVLLPFMPDGGAAVPVSAQTWVVIDPYREQP